ncbi:MAG: amidohydrolase family protein [Firmicutes bacterium]|nr:amidohydrolase family protein [Bacillota bacterium]
MQIIEVPDQASIKYGQLWDGLSEIIYSNGILNITNGFIKAINAHTSKEGFVFDYSHATLMPALIDSHIHLAFPYEDTQPLAQRAQQYLQAGVVAARDGGNTCGKLSVNSPFLLLQSIGAIYKKGHYGSALGYSVTNLSQALQLVDKLASLGAQHIKVVASGIFSFKSYGKTGTATFSASELRSIVDRAAVHKLPVMVHASGDEAVRRCLEAGVDTIEHGYFMTRETLKRLAASDSYWIPTLSPVNAQLAKPELFDALTPTMRDVITRSLIYHQELIAEGFALGAKILAGTDAGAPGVLHGISLIEEIMLLHNAGLSPLAALQAATSRAAQACRQTLMGSLAPGKKPYILVLKDNPLKNIKTLFSPEALLIPA